MSGIIQYLSFCVWLTPLRIMLSRVHLYCSKYQNLITFYGWIIFYLYITFFILTPNIFKLLFPQYNFFPTVQHGDPVTYTCTHSIFFTLSCSIISDEIVFLYSPVQKKLKLIAINNSKFTRLAGELLNSVLFPQTFHCEIGGFKYQKLT